MAENEGFVCIFRIAKNKGSAPSSRRRQRSSALHLIVQIPIEDKIKPTAWWVLFYGGEGGI